MRARWAASSRKLVSRSRCHDVDVTLRRLSASSSISSASRKCRIVSRSPSSRSILLRYRRTPSLVLSRGRRERHPPIPEARALGAPFAWPRRRARISIRSCRQRDAMATRHGAPETRRRRPPRRASARRRPRRKASMIASEASPRSPPGTTVIERTCGIDTLLYPTRQGSRTSSRRPTRMATTAPSRSAYNTQGSTIRGSARTTASTKSRSDGNRSPWRRDHDSRRASTSAWVRAIDTRRSVLADAPPSVSTRLDLATYLSLRGGLSSREALRSRSAPGEAPRLGRHCPAGAALPGSLVPPRSASPRS